MTSTDRLLLAEQLGRRLGLTNEERDQAQDALLDAVDEAALDLSAYLGYLSDPLPETFYGKVIALGAVYYRRTQQENETDGLKSASYSEGDVSQSETYLTGEAYQQQAERLLSALARYRRIKL